MVDKIFLNKDKLYAAIIMELFIIMTLVIMCMQIGHLTWIVVIVLLPLAYILISKKALTRIEGNEKGIKLTLFNKVITEFDWEESFIGIFGEYAGRRRLYYAYVARVETPNLKNLKTKEFVRIYLNNEAILFLATVYNGEYKAYNILPDAIIAQFDKVKESLANKD